MVRRFLADPVDPAVLDELLDLARRAPSAGYSQGTHFLVLEGADVRRFWAITLPEPHRSRFRWPGLLQAPVIVLPLADEGAYRARYAEADKAQSGLDEGEWPVPYWQIDTAMATMTLLLAVVDADLGALFFGLFRGEDEVLRAFGVPAGVRPIGAVAIGHPHADDRVSSSVRRGRRPLEEVVHRGRW